MLKEFILEGVGYLIFVLVLFTIGSCGAGFYIVNYAEPVKDKYCIQKYKTYEQVELCKSKPYPWELEDE